MTSIRLQPVPSYFSDKAAICENLVVSRQQSDAFHRGLSDKQTIKRIFVDVRQIVDGDRVLAENSQLAIAIVQQASSQHACIDPKVIAAQPVLDGDFPNAGDTEKQFVVR